MREFSRQEVARWLFKQKTEALTNFIIVKSELGTGSVPAWKRVELEREAFKNETQIQLIDDFVKNFEFWLDMAAVIAIEKEASEEEVK
jgi:hypothetical protein